MYSAKCVLVIVKAFACLSVRLSHCAILSKSGKLRHILQGQNFVPLGEEILLERQYQREVMVIMITNRSNRRKTSGLTVRS